MEAFIDSWEYLYNERDTRNQLTRSSFDVKTITLSEGFPIVVRDNRIFMGISVTSVSTPRKVASHMLNVLNVTMADTYILYVK